MADEIKDKNVDLPGPPPDPDEVNPNAVPTQAAAPKTVTAPPPDIPPALDIGSIDLNEADTKLGKIISKLGDFAATVQGQAADFFQDFQNPFSGIKNLSLIGKLKLSSIILLLALFGVIIHYWGGRWTTFFEDHTVYSLTDKATQIIQLNPEEPPVEFGNDLLVPQHIVLLNKVVVNLKPSARSGDNPMAAFNIFLHATNQEAAIEIKDRERELQDFVQRITEDFSYDQLQSEGGKRKWKIALKSELNLVLTQGKIKDIYFNTLLIKP